MSEIGGLTFEIFLEGEMVMRVTVDQRLSRGEVRDCLRTLELGLETAEKEGFSDSGVFNWEMNGKTIQVVHKE